MGGFWVGRPVQWLRELHRLHAEAARSRVETFARRDIEQLFGIGCVQAQALMKAVGGLQAVAGAHFLERPALLAFLDELLQAPRPEQALQARLEGAQPAPRPKPLRIRLPGSLRTAMLPELPRNVRLTPGRIEILAPTAEQIAESLLALALVMQNDDRWRELVEPTASPVPVKDDEDDEIDELDRWLEDLRARHADPGDPAGDS